MSLVLALQSGAVHHSLKVDALSSCEQGSGYSQRAPVLKRVRRHENVDGARCRIVRKHYLEHSGRLCPSNTSCHSYLRPHQRGVVAECHEVSA